MCLGVYFSDMIVTERCIYLGGRNIGMSQHLLYRSQIRAVLHKMRGKAVAERMRRDIHFYAGFFCIILYQLPEALSAHGLAGHIYKERLLVIICYESSS